MRVIVAIFCACIGIVEAQAQSGTLRPSWCDGQFRVSVEVHPVTQPQYPVKLSGLNPTFSAAKWSLIKKGQHFLIQSQYQAGGVRAITVPANAAAGAVVVATKLTNDQSQLWTVNERLGFYSFVSVSSGLMLNTSGSSCNNLTTLSVDISDGGRTAWLWNNP